jgi:hypothetical protein
MTQQQLLVIVFQTSAVISVPYIFLTEWMNFNVTRANSWSFWASDLWLLTLLLPRNASFILHKMHPWMTLHQQSCSLCVTTCWLPLHHQKWFHFVCRHHIKSVKVGWFCIFCMFKEANMELILLGQDRGQCLAANGNEPLHSIMYW